ncbi:hypothetical protein K470DRAFT_260578 [Piedraia hortae CBS 480.64]|uniref:Succinate dehydrogenase [ubiquinone] cytochrome b small subunit n=1 Tax=Piedraia hortae CBS 480.64 TaxID=1314780 RepID=A0A6A7BQY6_9PEZI|nr:hypothetical protein K470DRAFT_260578 [Piedraia hortae CBS 480.64]
MASVFRSALLRQTASRSVRFPQPAATLTPRVRAFVPRSAFQTSANKQILPPLPQTIAGTVNDAVRVPDPEPMHGAYHWTFERLLSASLLPITIAPYAAGVFSPLMDGTFVGLLIIHSYIGFQSCITDYFPSYRVPIFRKVCDFLNFFLALVVGWGWYEFETNDVGLTGAIRRIWKAGRE